MGEQPEPDPLQGVNVHRAQGAVNAAAGYAEFVRSRAARELRALRERHEAMPKEQRPHVLDVYREVIAIFDRCGERPRFEAGRRKRESVTLGWPTIEHHRLRERGARLVRAKQREDLRELCQRAGLVAEPHVAELELAWSVEVGLPEQERVRLLSEPMRFGRLARVRPERLGDVLDGYAGAAVAAGASERFTD
jgi:hypothetical protein